MEQKPPTYGNGKICYLEIPATDIEASATFYNKCFGWTIRRHDDGSVAFDDGVGQVSGMWVLNRRPMTEAGIIVSIMVDNADTTNKLVTANRGEILYSEKMESGEIIMHFKDPTGNLMGIYQRNADKSF